MVGLGWSHAHPSHALGNGIGYAFVDPATKKTLEKRLESDLAAFEASF